MATIIFPRWRPAAILNLVEPEVGPFDPPTSKILPLEPNMKWIGLSVAEIWPFEIFQNERSVGRNQYYGATEIAGLDNDGRLTDCGVFGLL